MAVDEAEATASAGAWVDQAATGAATTSANATQAAASAWSGFASWYSAAAVASQAELVSQTSAAAQDAVLGMFSQYVAELVALLSGTRVIVPQLTLQPVRNGADPLRVHSRPAYVFREVFATTGNEYEAQRLAVERAIQVVETDIMLAARQAQMEAMEELRITSYRRVLRPELSDSGPCGLCVVAADRIYSIKELLPLHGRCKCETMPIVDGVDPGLNLNESDLRRIYAAAGDSQKAADLKRTRVVVNEHGELGPVLSLKGQKFTGPDNLGEPREAMIKDRLGKLETILFEFRKRDSAGEDLSAPIAFQERLIETAQRRLVNA